MPNSTRTAHEIRDWLSGELPRLADLHGVPAAAAAVLAGGETVDAATGVLHLGTGVEATTDSLFQIGSITKVWTATLIMQLVDDGLLDLDAPVRTYLPEFRIADETAAAAITTRQLLSHRAGFEGDLFTDTGRGDDAVEKYVTTLADTPQLFPPGTAFSYNNAGYIVLGRIIEVLRGANWEQVLTDRLIGPLGLTHAAPSPYEAIMYRVAQGHIPGPDGALAPAPLWALARSNGPAGATLAMRASDLITFAKAHLDGGVAADGTRVLSAASVDAMRQVHSELPALGVMADAWGLGWEIDNVPGARIIGHDGSTIGQNAFLRTVPELGIAVALLTNGGNVLSIYRDLVSGVFEQLTGRRDLLKELPTPEVTDAILGQAEAARFVGTYSASVLDMIVSRDDKGRLWMSEVPKGFVAELAQPESETQLVLHGPDALITVEKSQGTHWLYAFLGDDGHGRAAFLHTGRAMPRTT